MRASEGVPNNQHERKKTTTVPSARSGRAIRNTFYPLRLGSQACPKSARPAAGWRSEPRLPPASSCSVAVSSRDNRSGCDITAPNRVRCCGRQRLSEVFPHSLFCGIQRVGALGGVPLLLVRHSFDYRVRANSPESLALRADRALP